MCSSVLNILREFHLFDFAQIIVEYGFNYSNRIDDVPWNVDSFNLHFSTTFVS